jgi:glutamate racemase
MMPESAALEGSGRPIAIFDSGIGGLPYLASARASLPGESYVYIADRAGFPYGTKTRAELRDIVVALVGRVRGAFDPKALVIACNTASQAGLEAARRANPGFPIIGTVPAVKPAAERTRSGIIAVMATAGTVGDPYLDALVARCAKEVRVIRVAAQPLVAFVERRSAFASPEERRAAVEGFVRPLTDAGADEIVLACTHFLHLRDDIAAAAGPGVEVVDSRDGVAGRLKAVLSERGLLATAGAVPPARSRFVLTGEGPFEPEYAILATAFGLDGPTCLSPRPREARA